LPRSPALTFPNGNELFPFPSFILPFSVEWFRFLWVVDPPVSFSPSPRCVSKLCVSLPPTRHLCTLYPFWAPSVFFYTAIPSAAGRLRNPPPELAQSGYFFSLLDPFPRNIFLSVPLSNLDPVFVLSVPPSSVDSFLFSNRSPILLTLEKFLSPFFSTFFPMPPCPHRLSKLLPGNFFFLLRLRSGPLPILFPDF